MAAYKWESRGAVYRDVYCRRAFIYTNGLCRVNQSQLYIIHTSTVCMHLHIQYIFLLYFLLCIKIMWSNQLFVGFFEILFLYISSPFRTNFYTYTLTLFLNDIKYKSHVFKQNCVTCFTIKTSLICEIATSGNEFYVKLNNNNILNILSSLQ
jgi:hypothetical protein